MTKILVLHGPNLNLLGRREPEKYGRMTLAEIDDDLRRLGAELGVEVTSLQSNDEGALVTRIQETRDDGTAGIVINAAAYTHTSIAIREGDHVKSGQVLVTLDDVQIRTELSIMSGQLSEMKGRQLRLIAERDGMLAISFPAGYGSSFHEASIMSGEIKLFKGNLLNRNSQKSQLELQIGQLKQEIEGLSAQENALRDEIEMVASEQTKLNGLAKKGLMEGSKVYSINREVARMNGELGSIIANKAQAEGKMSETRVRIMSIDEAARNEAQRELRTVDANVVELEDRFLAAQDRLEDTVIKSPISGTVNELGVTTIGGVITPAQSLVTIVPDSADLKVEFRIRTSDIDQIAIGQSTKLKLSAFNQRTTPELDGEITHVSAAAQRDAQTGEAFYLGDVRLQNGAESLGDLKLVPGMPVEVFVQTQERTAISYFVKPFTDQFARALREE